MARWKLTEPHYLRVPGTRWEYTENDRQTQRPKRTTFDVPLHLDPRIESDWNYQDQRGMDGEIIVCWEGKGLPKDIVFIGDPGPGMLPLDDEAREISAKFNWTPTQGLDPAQQDASFQAGMLNDLIKKLADATVAGQTMAAPAGFETFMASMAAMMQQQTQLLAALVGNKIESHPDQVVDTEPLLEDESPSEDELKKATEAAAKADALSKAKALAHMQSRRI